MRSFWTDRRLTVVPALVFFSSAQILVAQRTSSSGAGAAASSSNSGGSVTRGNNVPTSNTGIGNSTSTSSNTIQQPIFLSGTVMFDDGSPTNTDIKIERICGGSTRLEAHTDSRGRFSFQIGQNPAAFQDASDVSSGSWGGNGNQGLSSSGFGNVSNGNSMTFNPLWNCELRASYPGFRSDTIDLSTRHSLDSPDLGTLVLHRLVNVQGSTISMTSELAPKPAQKAYQKGLKAVQNGKAEEAEKDLQQATDLYPKYAIAWYALGQMQQRAGKTDLARKSYLAAVAADSKYLSPYDRLAFMSAHDNKWDEAADYSKHVIQLNPVEFPSSFWYNALSNYQLQRSAEAEQSVTDLLKLDTQHKFPQAEFLLGQLLLDKGKYPEAAIHLRAYLKLEPNAKDAEALKATLSKLEQASAQTKTPAAPPQ